MIELKNIRKSFNDKVLFDNLNINFEESKTTVILGKSGSGKTSILNMISGILDYQGDILNKPVSVGYIFQEDRLIPDVSVLDNIKFTASNLDMTKLDFLLNVLNLDSKINSKARTLSGGEAKRVNIIRALLSDSSIILADEALSSLDTGLKIKIIEFLNDYISKNNLTFIYVTHDIEEALMLGDKIIILNDGNIIKEYINKKSNYLENKDIKNDIINVMIKISE